MKSKILLLIVFANSYLLNGQDLFVNQNAQGQNNGQSWIDAYHVLDSALNNANDEDTIWVAKGIYRPSENDRDVYFEVIKLNLIGGFSGNESTIDERDFIKNKTILCGDIGQENEPTDNSYSVAFVSNALMDGFIIQNGYGDNDISSRGGGIKVLGTVIIKNCVFINNYSKYGGAAGFTSESGLSRFENCKFISNSAEYGGAISQQNCPFAFPIIFNGCLFNNNTANKDGGAVYLWKGGFTGVNCTFVNNSSCMYVYDYNSLSKIRLINTIFNSNEDDDEFSTMFQFSGENDVREFQYCLFPTTTEIPWDINVKENIFANPIFQDELGNDNILGTFDDNFQLLPNSPGINKGNMIIGYGAFLLDFDYYFNNRVFEDSVDIGAYETHTYSGIGDNIVLNSFTVNPNPTSNSFSINLKRKYRNITVFVINSEGELLEGIFYNDTNKITGELNGRVGLYFICIYEKNKEIACLKVLKAL